MKKEMLINVSQPEECRIAIVEDGILEELYIERSSQDNYVGNIYKGKVVNLEPSIQAAFVDFGVGRNGFLHISDVEPQYFRQGGYNPNNPIPRNGDHGKRDTDGQHKRPDQDSGGQGRSVGAASAEEQTRRRRTSRPGIRPRVKPPIQDLFRRGDEVLVQVIKEGIGTKGPTLSTYISIPGRYLVLMPALGRVGVSRKIEDDEVRRKLRGTLLELNPPKGLGFIVRTAGIDRTKKELSRDIAYLLRLWRVIVRRIKKQTAPIDIYEESDMIIRTIRDIFTTDVDAMGPEVKPHREILRGRTMLVHKADRIDAECVARGYITGSGWVAYQREQAICGIALPPGMLEAEPFPETLFTPSTKAETGHDENIGLEAMREIVGDAADRLRELTIAVYEFGRDYAKERGIIVADTKFEFGYVGGEITLIDEILTPDSSRFSFYSFGSK